MFICPHCGKHARTRTSRRLSNLTVRQYHQCQNLECSAAFTTLNAYEGLVAQNRRKDATEEPALYRTVEMRDLREQEIG